MSIFQLLFLIYLAQPSKRDVKFSFSLTDSELTGNIQIRNGYPAPACTGNFQVIKRIILLHLLYTFLDLHGRND